MSALHDRVNAILVIECPPDTPARMLNRLDHDHAHEACEHSATGSPQAVAAASDRLVWAVSSDRLDRSNSNRGVRDGHRNVTIESANMLIRRKLRAARSRLAELVGSESIVGSDLIRIGTLSSHVAGLALAALTPHHLHIVRIIDSAVASTMSLRMDEITWIEPDGRNYSHPLVLRSTELDTPLWLVPVTSETLAKRLVTVCWASPGLELVIRLDGTDSVVEYRPPRPGAPGGWYGNSPAGAHHSDAAIALAKDKWRTAELSADPAVVRSTLIRITPELTDEVAVDCLLRYLKGFEQGPHVIARSRDMTPYVLTLLHDDILAAIEYALPSGECRVTPWITRAPLADTDVSAGAHTFDGQYIYVTFPRTTRMLRVEASDLDQNWRPFISKAVRSPAPLLSF